MFKIASFVLFSMLPPFLDFDQEIRAEDTVNDSCDSKLAVVLSQKPAILDDCSEENRQTLDSAFAFTVVLLRKAKAQSLVNDSLALTEATKLTGLALPSTIFNKAKIIVNGKIGTVFIVCTNQDGNLPIIRCIYDSLEEVVRLQYITRSGTTTAYALL
ncbi:hypothetical protein C4546_04585 [Candidatus Parcubacteria bacterium]|jgi:hypothetical protein|nr:MAG: hypothetical protein C4546_04585 [Candidatus Parcubacteria bacterium]